MQSDRQQQFTWSQEESPVWKHGLLPSATWIDLTRSVFFIFPHGIPIFFATSFTSFIFITVPPIKVIISFEYHAQFFENKEKNIYIGNGFLSSFFNNIKQLWKWELSPVRLQPFILKDKFIRLSAGKKRGKMEGATPTPEPLFCRLALTKHGIRFIIDFIY